MKKITHLTSAHARFDTRIFLKECSSLAANGFIVSLIVADGKGDERKNNVEIYDVGAPCSRWDRFSNATRRVFFKAIEFDSDIYHLHDPELIPIGLKLKKMGKKVVYDIHENTDLQILSKEWIPFYLRKPISWLYSKYELYACKTFDALIVPQVAMQQKFSQYAKTEIIANFPSASTDLILRNNLSKYNLLYAGGLTKARGLYNMLELICCLNDIDPRYNLTLAGPISEVDLAEAQHHPGWKNTTYLGMLNREEVYSAYKDASVGLILFNNVGQYYMAYALKLFEYMQNGLIVIMPDFGDWLNFNETYRAGFNVKTSCPKEVAEALTSIDDENLKTYSLSNQKCAATHFLWSTQENKLVNLYSELLHEN